MFAWDETAFLELFGVVPRVDTSEGIDVLVAHAQGSVKLQLGFNALTGDVRVQVFAAGQGEPLFDGRLASSPGARVVRNAGPSSWRSVVPAAGRMRVATTCSSPWSMGCACTSRPR